MSQVQNDIQACDPISIPELLSRVLSLSTDVEMDKVLDVMDKVEAAKAKLKEVSASLESAVIEWIKANGDIEMGTVRWYVGLTKTTKCIDNGKTLEALFEACGGDFAKVAEMLASGAFKHGACKGVLSEDQYAALFVVKESDELKEGKPNKRLQKVDSRFLK